MSKVTYQIRVDRRDSDTVWIDQFVDGDRKRTYGPYWSKWEAVREIKIWEAEVA